MQRPASTPLCPAPTVRRPYKPRDAASRHLAAADPDFAALIGRVGRCRLTPDRTRSPYEALVRAVAHQQVHGRAAEAILGRLIGSAAEGGFPTPREILDMAPDAVRGCGFSASKAASIRDIAGAAARGAVPTRQGAARLPDAHLIERLVTLRGVGRWTVEMLLIFSLGRPDVLPVDDFAVREGYRRLKGLAVPPTAKVLSVLGLRWAPFRSTAAWYLWRASEEGRAAVRSEVTG